LPEYAEIVVVAEKIREDLEFLGMDAHDIRR